MKYQSVNKDSGKSLSTVGDLADLSSGPVTHWASWGSVCSEMQRKEEMGTPEAPKQCSLWNRAVPRIPEIHRFLGCEAPLTSGVTL